MNKLNGKDQTDKMDKANFKNQKNSINTINKFDEIMIIPNSLIVLDIDETLIKFENINNAWWHEQFEKIYIQTNDYDLTEKILNNKWIESILDCVPVLVDENIHDFIENASKLNCEIILLTARDVMISELTLKHLSEVNLNFFITHHNKNKGEYLKKLCDKKYSHYNDITMVDDLLSNLEDVNEWLGDSQYKLHLYNIK